MNVCETLGSAMLRLGAILAFLLPLTAFGFPVSFYFSGTVDFDPIWVSDPNRQQSGYSGPSFNNNPFSTIHRGTRFHGTFSYDTEAPRILNVPGQASYLSGPPEGVYDADNRFTVKVTFDGTTYESFSTMVVIENRIEDRYGVGGNSYTAMTPTYTNVGLQLGTAPGRDLFVGTSLPESPPSLSSVDYASFGFSYQIFLPTLGVFYQPINFTGTIDSLVPSANAISEPATALLGLTCASLVVFLGRARRSPNGPSKLSRALPRIAT